MGSISKFLEGALLNHIFNGVGVIYTPTDPNYLGLSDADPVNDASGISEPSGGSYARIPITFGAASARSLINIIANFPQATGAWGDMSDWFICNHATNATFGTNVEMLAFGGLSDPKTIVSGNAPIIPAGDIAISLKTLGIKGTGENVSDYLANKLLDFVFRNQTFAQPEIYMGYATTILADNTTGSTVVEPASGAYGRKLVSENGGSSPTWDLQVNEVIDNTHDIDLAIATGSWGIIVSQFLVDHVGTGNILFYDNDGVVDQLVGANDIVRAAAGACDISLT
jgi:hypothetical protein